MSFPLLVNLLALVVFGAILIIATANNNDDDNYDGSV